MFYASHTETNTMSWTSQSFQLSRFSRNMYESWAPMAHICNPSYSGGRDQKQSSPRQIVFKTLSQKGAGRVAQTSKTACLASMRPWKKRKKKRDGARLPVHWDCITWNILYVDDIILSFFIYIQFWKVKQGEHKYFPHAHKKGMLGQTFNPNLYLFL
jgi:hypothetical protein